MRAFFSVATLLVAVVLVAPQVSASSSPTASPESCTNDDDFLFRDKIGHDCSWVAERKKRCRKVDKTTGIRVAKSCPLVCKSKCASYVSEAPTAAPTSEAFQYCLDDDEDFGLNNDESKNCEWAAEKPNQRCGLKDFLKKKRVKDYCRSACNWRCACKNSRKFQLNKKKTSCSKVNTKKCSNSTGKNGLLVSDFCPKKCGTCLYFPSESPTAMPSMAPSASPSAAPTSSPSDSPSDSPSAAPTVSFYPSLAPSQAF